MEGFGSSDATASVALIVRQFDPSRIERQLLAQVFDLVTRWSHDLAAPAATDGREPVLGATWSPPDEDLARVHGRNAA
jgi:hypothetical protein